MQILKSDGKGIEAAVEELKKGNVVAIPTETVYGLAANALDGEAVKKIFLAKGRPQDNPLIIHISQTEDLKKYAIPNEIAYKLAEKFWPGPLTMILPKLDCIPTEVSAGLDTVAVRMPNHPVARELIKKSGVPLAAPSANISGKPSPTSAEHVIDDFSENPYVSAVIDGGKCQCGVESTVLSLCGEEPCLLRPGFITADMLKEVIPNLKIAEAVLKELPNNEKALSPGLKHKHYAPSARTVCIKGLCENAAEYVKNDGKDKKTVICFAGEEEKFPRCKIIPYGRSNDFEELAENLFDALRKADKIENEKIYVRIPEINDELVNGILLAVYNRLLRAASFTVIDCDKAVNGLVLGITGQSGAGKGTVCKVLENKGFIHIDTDKIWHEIIDFSAPALEEIFGKITDENGKVDRKILGEKAFSSEENLKMLNSVAHKAIMAKVSEIMDENRSRGLFNFAIDGAALFEAGAKDICDFIITVTADRKSRLERVKIRDGIDDLRAEMRFAGQKSEDFYTENADFTILNDDLTALPQKIQHILAKISKK
ncbi:MAG: threonylcarbamoyl-AMP synthase [Clostridia bacterium]|nr:threonylcarbamoyl-AMP synthase [Clostridia bacterium]